MAKRRVPATRWTWAAVAACVVAAAFLVATLRAGDPSPGPGSAPRSAEPAKADAADDAAAAFSLKPAEDYAEMVERPLFVRGRKPAAVEDSKTPGQGPGEDSPAAQISLTGILLVGKHRVALLRLDGDPKVMHVAEGQEAGGWLIERIRPDRVMLRRGDSASELVLDFRRKPENLRAGHPGPDRSLMDRPGSHHGEPPPNEDEDLGE